MACVLPIELKNIVKKYKLKNQYCNDRQEEPSSNAMCVILKSGIRICEAHKIRMEGHLSYSGYNSDGSSP